MGSTSRPGVSRGTKHASERSPSFPNTRDNDTNWPQLIHFLAPFRTRESPRESVNSVTREWISLPPPGSVKAKAPIISPWASIGIHFRICSTLPHFSRALQTMVWTVSTPFNEEDPLPNASFSKPKVTVSHPCPPFWVGRLQPK